MSNPSPKPLLIEIGWLLLALVLSIACAYFLFDWQKDGTIDIYIYDTYYVLPIWIVILPLFVAIGIILFLAKESRNRFSRKIPGFIILVLAVILIVCLSAMINYMPSDTEFTVYSPLSVLGDAPAATDNVSEMLIPFSLLIILQIAVAAIAMLVAYRLGVARSKSA